MLLEVFFAAQCDQLDTNELPETVHVEIMKFLVPSLDDEFCPKIVAICKAADFRAGTVKQSIIDSRPIRLPKKSRQYYFNEDNVYMCGLLCKLPLGGMVLRNIKYPTKGIRNCEQ